ncbi:hypothetical protein P691DRAFT_776966 [Macrolepiota fuliginosa MF-IS2]|uniref:Phosphatidylinositol-specific phospholipase C X domain-containing protein n=1 Tax=Macrolepiota fuliginosa MF-IS2 TaxID=1400762 RepID=A0A9P5XAJ1_9AGAR|nr:hypothetical protein P691DRAFT_776966 [Macrolepiota fuliginosa MF-IS2]
MDPQPYSELQQQQQLAESLAVYTSCNFHPPSTPIRLSEHVKTFLRDVLGDDVPSVLAKPALRPPEVRNDLALADYFVSSSHNTYLLANQILGRSSAYSYTHVLSRGARCVADSAYAKRNSERMIHSLYSVLAWLIFDELYKLVILGMVSADGGL